MKNFLMKILHMIYVFGRGVNGNKEEFSHIESDTDLQVIRNEKNFESEIFSSPIKKGVDIY